MKFRLLVAVAMATVVAFAMVGAANASPAPENTKSVATIGNADVVKVALGNSNAGLATAWPVACPAGNVCFYDQPDGQGNRCSWDVYDPDWTSGTITCSIRDNIRSVWNNGTSGARWVAFYTGVNNTGTVGCASQGARGNLASTFYKLRSHRWINGACA